MRRRYPIVFSSLANSPQLTVRGHSQPFSAWGKFWSSDVIRMVRERGLHLLSLERAVCSEHELADIGAS
jgi:hypothetical protein